MRNGTALRLLVAAKDDPKLAAWASVLHEFKLPIDCDIAHVDHWEAFEALFVHDAITSRLFNNVTYKELLGYKPCPAALQETLDNLRILPEQDAEGEPMTRVRRDNAIALRPQSEELALPESEELALPEPFYGELALPQYEDLALPNELALCEAPVKLAPPPQDQTWTPSPGGMLQLQPRNCENCGIPMKRELRVEDFAMPDNPDAQFTSYYIHSKPCRCGAVSCERVVIPV